MDEKFELEIDDKVMLEGEDTGPKNAFEFLEATKGIRIEYKLHKTEE